MALTHKAQAMLCAYHAGSLQNAIAHGKALGQVGLDYTPESLERIDRLLRQMHAQLKPRVDAFVGVPTNDNFLLLLGYYIGTVIARFTLQRIEWYAPDELAQVLPAADLEQIDVCFQSSVTCTFHRDGAVTGFFMPLSPIHDILFDGDTTRSVAESAGRYLRRAVSLPVLRAPPAAVGAQRFASSDQPGTVGEALHRLGLLAGSQTAWACRTALEDDGTLAPQLIEEFADSRRQITSLLFMLPDEAFAAANRRLDEPEPTVAGTAFAYDGHINLPRFRTDALVVEARWHAPEVRATIAVPYRNASKAGGFALFSPRVLESSLAEGYLPVLEAAFFAGIESVNPPGLWAARHLDEDDPDNLAARIAEQAAAAYPAPGDPFADVGFDTIDVAAGIAALPPDQADYAQVAMPWWAEDDALAELFGDIPSLLREGRVVWGQLVQANADLFETGHDDGLPGDVLYDPAGRLTPTDLAPIARSLFASRQQIEALRAADPPQAERLRLAEHFENEMSRARALRVPPGDAHGELLVSTTYFVRRHLPTQTLMLSYFPLLILDRRPGSVIVLPSRWWPSAVLDMWSRVRRERTRAAWQQAWEKLAAGGRDEEDERHWQGGLESIRNYARRGVSDEDVRPWVSIVNADGSRRDRYTGNFGPDTEPAPREWEWGLGGTLASLAEAQTRDLERLRARGQPLDVGLARLAYAMRHTAQMIDLHTRLLDGRRGCDPEGGIGIDSDEIQWAALGLVAGCEQPALHTARVLCATWQHRQLHREFIRPEVRAIFILMARQLGIPLPDLVPFKPLPALEALIDADRWLHPDAGALAPRVEAACIEHTEEAPEGPFRGLPIAICLLFKLRAMRGLANPAVTHPLLAVPLGDWAAPVDFDACLDPLLRAVRDRLKRHGFDEAAIAAAVIDGTPLEAPPAFARPALPPADPPPAAKSAGIGRAAPGNGLSAGGEQDNRAATAAEVEAWERQAIAGFKARLAESTIRRTLTRSACPPDYVDAVVDYARGKVRWQQRIEGFSMAVAGVVLLFVTRALVTGHAEGNSSLFWGLLGGGLTASGVYRIFSSGRRRA